ncbi:MAG: hypothetical protein BWY66_01095 [bacterium ADurb.Bin374]|nr:MAG: hypothetical protein BWY66_01095 [bacterium ADurb.Bin374]
MIFPLDPLHLLRHPSQLYEAFFEGIVLFAVLSEQLQRRCQREGLRVVVDQCLECRVGAHDVAQVPERVRENPVLRVVRDLVTEAEDAYLGHVVPELERHVDAAQADRLSRVVEEDRLELEPVARFVHLDPFGEDLPQVAHISLEVFLSGEIEIDRLVVSPQEYPTAFVLVAETLVREPQHPWLALVRRVVCWNLLRVLASLRECQVDSVLVAERTLLLEMDSVAEQDELPQDWGHAHDGEKRRPDRHGIRTFIEPDRAGDRQESAFLEAFQTVGHLDDAGIGKGFLAAEFDLRRPDVLDAELLLQICQEGIRMIRARRDRGVAGSGLSEETIHIRPGIVCLPGELADDVAGIRLEIVSRDLRMVADREQLCVARQPPGK